MIFICGKLYLCLVLLASWQQTLANKLISQLGKSAGELLRARGYLAEDHYVTTSDGYILNLVRGINPLINNTGALDKKPVLFVHGSQSNCKFYILSSGGVKPKDYSELDAGSMSLRELNKLLANDPASYSLVYTALNFGHEVWLLNRRGTSYSQGHISGNREAFLEKSAQRSSFNAKSANITFGSSKPKQSKRSILSDIVDIFRVPSFELKALRNIMNPKYWNFSLDEEAKLDIPEVIDYILQETNQPQLALVGQSSGGAIILMALSENEALNKKVSKTLLWAPAFNIGARKKRNILIEMYHFFLKPIMLFPAGLPTSFFVPLTQKLAAFVCYTKMAQDTLCESLSSLVFGKFGHQQIMNHQDPGIVSAHFEPFASHQLAQLLQSDMELPMRHYDFGSARKNIAKYGSVRPPAYDLSKITTDSLSFWYGEHDNLVDPGAVEFTQQALRVPYESHRIAAPGLYFNHVSFVMHKNASTLVVIPGIKTIEAA